MLPNKKSVLTKEHLAIIKKNYSLFKDDNESYLYEEDRHSDDLNYDNRVMGVDRDIRNRKKYLSVLKNHNRSTNHIYKKIQRISMQSIDDV